MRRDVPGFGSEQPPTAPTSGLTYTDYCALPDDGLRYEILEGRLVSEPYRVGVSLAGDETFEPTVFPGLTFSLADLGE